MVTFLLRVNVNNPIITVINVAINVLFCLFYYYGITVELRHSIGHHNNLGFMMVMVMICL